VSRAGARPGDALYVTGRLGGPLRALRAFEPARRRTRQTGPLRAPEARITAARWLGERGARALVDVSDGLAADLAHVAAASGVRCVVEVGRVPAADGATASDALASGEEYELACAAPPDLDAGACLRETGVALTRIGRVEVAAGGGPGVELAARGGRRVDLPPGHDHLTR
jgi:thiamine-monophosphate kinase